MAANDLDLDELHEAVNALMVDAGKGKTKKKSTPVSTTPSEEPKAVLPKETPATRPTQPQKIEVRRPLPSIASSARGRTMDVVGPKPVPKVVPPSAQAKRQAPTLQPTSPMVVPESPKPVVVAPQTVDQQVKEPADDILASINMKQEQRAPTLTHQKSEWPDPLDVHGFKDDPEEEVKAAADPELVGKPASPIKPDPDDSRPQEDDIEPPEESNSPFVTTKVEKRPLGAYADAVPPPAPTPEAQKPEPEPAFVATQQPKEFSPEVVAVESAEPEFHKEVQNAETDMHELRQMSIPQQYQQAEKSSNKDTRSVFDTKDYHPPIDAAHAAHRTGSSLGWIMILVFTIILVVALVFAYYMITGSLDVTQLLP